MLVSRSADTDQGDALPLPLTLVAGRRSLRSFRRFLVVGAIIFVALPLALFAVLDETPFQFLPLALTIAGLFWLRLESLSLERDLRRARVRALDAVDTERERIQRDLHDGAQQRLVSIRIHMGLLAQEAATEEDRAAIEALGTDLEAALTDIRNVTRDGSPELLLRSGVVECLKSVAAHTPRKVTVQSRGFGRYSREIERGVYFCCVEALQNAAKHAGPNATVLIRLTARAAPDHVLDRRLGGRLRSGPGRGGRRARQPRRPGRRDGRRPDDRLLPGHGNPDPRRDPRRPQRGSLTDTAFPLLRLDVDDLAGGRLRRRGAPPPPQLDDAGRVGRCAPRSRTCGCARFGARRPPCQPRPSAAGVSVAGLPN